MNIEYLCTVSRISLDLLPQVWEAQNVHGGGIPVNLVRLFHNKFFFWLDNLFRCYGSYYSPDFLVPVMSVVGVFLFYVGAYGLFARRKLPVLGMLLLAPIPALIEVGPVIGRTIILFGVYWSVVVYGLYCLGRYIDRKLRK